LRLQKRLWIPNRHNDSSLIDGLSRWPTGRKEKIMTLHQLLTEGEEALIDAGIQEAALDARCLLLEAFHTDTMHFLMNRMRQLAESSETDAAMTVYRKMIAKRSRRIPLQHILG